MPVHDSRPEKGETTLNNNNNIYISSLITGPQTNSDDHTHIPVVLFDAPPFCTELLRRLIMVYIQYNSHTLQLSAQQEKRQQFHLRGAKNFPPGLEVSARAERLLKRRDMRNSAFLNPPPKLAKTRLSFPHSPSFFWTSHVNIII